MSSRDGNRKEDMDERKTEEDEPEPPLLAEGGEALRGKEKRDNTQTVCP